MHICQTYSFKPEYRLGNKIRVLLCKNLFLKCGSNVNWRALRYGTSIEIGSNLSIGPRQILGMGWEEN